MSEEQCTALVTEVNRGKATLVKKLIPVLKPEPNQALVKVSHVAQNPTDGKLYLSPSNRLLY